jgi:hypothetical protein
MLVFGIEDPGIWLAYILCILSALGCMVYGALNWRGGEEEQEVKSGVQITAVQDQ